MTDKQQHLLALDTMCRRMADTIYVNYGQDVNVGTTTLICTYIDALGSYLAGKDAGALHFKEFIKQYMVEFDRYAAGKSAMVRVPGQNATRPYMDIFYDQFRNGFVHSYIGKVSVAIIKNKPGMNYAPYFSEDRHGYALVVNLDWLIPDFLLGLEKYRQHVHTVDVAYRAFASRFNAIRDGA